MNALVKSQVKVMTDEGKYCSFKSMYGVVLKSMISTENVIEKHYFSAMRKLGILEKVGGWIPPEAVRLEMVENNLPSKGIYRRKKTAKGTTLNYSYGFNCKDEDKFIAKVLAPVIRELDILEAQLTIVKEQVEMQKEVLKSAGLPISNLNTNQAIEKVVSKWEK